MTAPNEQLTTPNGENKIRDLIQSDRFKHAVTAALPSHLKPDRFVRVALTALTRTPKLAQCEQASFFQCLITLSQFGLEPDGRNAHLIPFNNRKRNVVECQLIIDYKGLVDLAMRSGKIAKIHADKICQNDVFSYDRGEIKKHEVNFKVPRGDAYAYYALAQMKDGSHKCEVMTKDEIESIRKRSRADNDGPWVTDFDEMAKKSVFRRLSKWLQLSPEYRDALEADADALEEIRFQQAVPLIDRPKFDTPQIKDAEPKKRGRKPKEQGTLTPHGLRDELVKRLALGTYHPDNLMKLAIEKGWVDPDATFESLPVDKLSVLIETWDEVARLLDERFAKVEAPEPSDDVS
jgi:recombination protein RecT